MELGESAIWLFKTGTNVNVTKDGKPDEVNIEKLAKYVLRKQIEARESEDQFNLGFVVSGAITLGMKELGLKERPTDIVDLRVCATVGQPILIEAFQRIFSKYDLKTGQLLFTCQDLNNFKTTKKLKQTFYRSFKKGVIPLINFNDAIDDGEIIMDNDFFAARIGASLEVEKLIIFTKGVDGLLDYEGNLIPKVEVWKISDFDKYKKFCFQKTSQNSIGGMEAKIDAAAYFLKEGGLFATFIVANIDNNIDEIMAGKYSCTVFKIIRIASVVKNKIKN